MTTTDRTGADTATFEAEMQRLDRLEVADEDTVERVARAMYERITGVPWAQASDLDGICFRDQAEAAIASLKPAPGTDSSGAERSDGR